MALESVQTYEVNGNGVLTPIPNFIFQTDTSGSVILGGCGSSIDYINEPIFTNVAADGNWNPHPNYGTSSSIAAGEGNNITDGMFSFIGGGQSNFISGKTDLKYKRLDTLTCSKLTRGASSFIGGGTDNSIYSPKSIIVGGHNNSIEGHSLYKYAAPVPPGPFSYLIIPGKCIDTYPVSFTGEYVTGIEFMAPISRLEEINCGPGYNSIVGGRNNNIKGIFSFIGGGNNNKITSSTPANLDNMYHQYSGRFSFLGGGCNNTIIDSTCSLIGGGANNCIQASNGSSLLGGTSNYICARAGFIDVGWGNTIAGGQLNKTIGGCGQSIFGGIGNTISGAYSQGFSTILGGVYNTVHSPSDGFPGGLEVSQNNTIIGGACNNLGKGLSHTQQDFTARSSIVNGFKSTLYGVASNIIGSEFSCVNNSFVSIFGGRNISGHHYGSTIIGDALYNRQKVSAGEYTLTLDFASGTYVRNKIIIENDSSVPQTYNSFGISGQVAFDKNYLYRHNGENWTRTAMSTW